MCPRHPHGRVQVLAKAFPTFVHSLQVVQTPQYNCTRVPAHCESSRQHGPCYVSGDRMPTPYVSTDMVEDYTCSRAGSACFCWPAFEDTPPDAAAKTVRILGAAEIQAGTRMSGDLFDETPIQPRSRPSLLPGRDARVEIDRRHPSSRRTCHSPLCASSQGTGVATMCARRARPKE